jgi:hypothetical protein
MSCWLTDAQLVVLAAVRTGQPYAGLTRPGQINRRKRYIDRLINDGLVRLAQRPDPTVLSTGLAVNEKEVARRQRTWGHAIRPLNDRERAQVERDHGRTTERNPTPWATCSARRCTHKAEAVTLYSYVTGRRGRVSCAERFACPMHAERFRKKHGIALDAPPAPDVGAERRETMGAILTAIQDAK